MLSFWASLAGLLRNDRIKFRIYIFLNRPRSWIDLSYQLGLGLLIFTCMILTLFSSKGSYRLKNHFIFWLDLSIAIIFGVEFMVRLWSSTCLHRYRNWRGIHIIFHPMFMLDLFVLLATIAVLCFDIQETMLAVGLRGFRMLHFFENRYNLWKIVSSVIWSQRYQLAIVTYFCVVWMFVFSLAIYFAESPHNPQMTSLSKALWFTLVTFTTVGYGDLVPVSSLGKILASLGMIVGVSIFALPGGVIGAGLALKVQNQRAIKYSDSMKETLAAQLLQNAWRLYRIRKYIQMFTNSGIKCMPINLLTNGRSVFVGLSSESKRGFEAQEKSPNASYPTYLMQMNAYSLYFVYLLGYLTNQRKLRFSRRLSDTNSFYEIYTQNTHSTTQILKSLQGQLSKLETFIDNYHNIQNKVPRKTLNHNIRTKKLLPKKIR